jgi:tRNA(Ile)-lysidine synthase
VHVDHGLRAGSASEADVVSDAAARFGARFVAKEALVPPGPNLEARARAARYAVLPRDVLTGHTADDQAETVLLHLLRGAGLDGLAGMAPERHPILSLRRAETQALCRAEGLEPVVDPSNADPAHLRNRVRHEVLPLLDSVAGRDVAALLARQAALLRDDVTLLEDLAGAVDPTDAAALSGAPPALARRALRRWLAEAGDGYVPDARGVERVLAVARGGPAAAETAGGLRVRRRSGRLRVDPV